MVTELNEENYSVAINAICDILYMYYDLVESYKGFGHNIETGNRRTEANTTQIIVARANGLR